MSWGCAPRVSPTVRGVIGLCTQGEHSSEGWSIGMLIHIFWVICPSFSHRGRVYSCYFHYFSITVALDVSDWKTVQKTRSQIPPSEVFWGLWRCLSLHNKQASTLSYSRVKPCICTHWCQMFNHCMILWLQTHALLLECLPKLYTLTFLWFFLFFWMSSQYIPV